MKRPSKKQKKVDPMQFWPEDLRRRTHRPARSKGNVQEEEEWKEKVDELYDEVMAEPDVQVSTATVRHFQQKHLLDLFDKDIKVSDSKKWSRASKVSVPSLPALDSRESPEALVVVGDETSVVDVKTWDRSDWRSYLRATAMAMMPQDAMKAVEWMNHLGIQPTVIDVNHALNAYARAITPKDSKLLKQALHFFQNYQAMNLVPDLISHSHVVKAYTNAGRIKDAFHVRDIMMEAFGRVPLPVHTILIHGCIRHRRLDLAWSTFNELRLRYAQEPDVMLYSVMIHACAKNGEIERARQLFDDMVAKDLTPTDVTLNALVNACARRKECYGEVWEWVARMKEVWGWVPDGYTWNAVLLAAAARGDVERARWVFTQIVGLWEARNGGEEGVQSWPGDLEVAVTNLFYAYSAVKTGRSRRSLSSVDGEESALGQGVVVSQGRSLRLDLTVVPMSDAELIQDVEQVYSGFVQQHELFPDQVRVPSIRLLNAYLSVMSARKSLDKMLDIKHRELPRWNLQPNGQTFALFLRACTEAGDVDRLWQTWDELLAFWKSRPSPMTATDAVVECDTSLDRFSAYKSMVNGLARHGKLSRAIMLLREWTTADWIGQDASDQTCPPPSLEDVKLLYIRSVEMEDDVAKLMVLKACPPQASTSRKRADRVLGEQRHKSEINRLEQQLGL